MEPLWRREHYSFIGPGVTISCEVTFDHKEKLYVASSVEGFVGTSSHSEREAALACFEAWLTNRHAYYQQPPEFGGEKV